jgi:Yip1 domain
MSSASAAMPPEAQPLSEVERVIDTFVAPSKTFTDIRRNASWWLPWVLLSIFGLALVFTVDKQVGMDKVAENSIQLSPKRAAKVDQLPPDQRASQMETAAKWTRIIAYCSPVITVIVAGILAAVLMATFNFGLGAELKFMQCMAITMYAFLPGIIKALLVILTLMIGGGEGFTFEQQLASNLGPLVDPSSTFLHSIASSLDLFNIWTLILTGIGYSCVTRVKRGTCMAVIFGWWGIVVLAGGAIAALFS